MDPVYAVHRRPHLLTREENGILILTKNIVPKSFIIYIFVRDTFDSLFVFLRRPVLIKSFGGRFTGSLQRVVFEYFWEEHVMRVIYTELVGSMVFDSENDVWLRAVYSWNYNDDHDFINAYNNRSTEYNIFYKGV